MTIGRSLFGPSPSAIRVVKATISSKVWMSASSVERLVIQASDSSRVFSTISISLADCLHCAASSRTVSKRVSAGMAISSNVANVFDMDSARVVSVFAL